jgi:hypothetical protein
METEGYHAAGYFDMPLEVHQETGFLITWEVLTTRRFVWYYRTVYKNETYAKTLMYVEFKERKTGCGTHCTELKKTETYVWTQYTLTKKCC